MERRRRVRFRKRLEVRYGRESPDRLGWTDDISSNGLFINCNSVIPTMTEVKLAVTLPNG